MNERMKERHLFHYTKYKHLYFEQRSVICKQVINSAIFTSHVLRNQVKGVHLFLKNWYILVRKAFLALYK